PTPEQKARLEAATKAEAEARRRLEREAAGAGYSDPDDKGGDRRPVRDVLLNDTFPYFSSNRNTTRDAAVWLTDPPFGAARGRRVLRQANSFFHQDVIDFRTRPVVVPHDGAFEAMAWLDPGHPPAAISVQLAGAKKVWWGQEGVPNVPERPGLGTRLGDLPPPGQWAKLTVTAAELGLKPGQHVANLALQEYGGVVYWDAVALAGETDPRADPLESFRVWWKGLGGKATGDIPAELHPVVAAGPDKKPDPKQVDKLRAFYLAYIVRPRTLFLATARLLWESARADREAADAAIPGTMTFRDLPKPRDAFVMTRGQYDKPGEKVEPGVPAVLPPLKPAGPRPTRLDLANWLVSPENPLVARVQVNRLWQQFFGTGLVKSGGDFGSQGEPPSHPELLDWLADEYRTSGWDTKKLVRLLVTSDAFRRDSRLAPALRAKDPENRLLARGPRFRLDAEQLRDNALFAGGLLNPRAGGRGSMPYQPGNIWEPLGFGDSNTRYYLQDRGPDVHRRSVYVFLKRTAPHPFLANFDAPNREQVCAARDRTNTPLQALQLMNDVQHFEAARALAERVLADGGATTEARITFLYRTVLARRPDAEELRVVAGALEKQRALFKADPAAARKVVHVGESKPRGVAADDEVAAWTLVANLVLNLDEAVTRN
ncbi:MAG: DUF1553 domain-containing protein, partial [Gemmataceae bacterium]|nr:DUF1553 domain-containing protein [Gemmataceae bacterium]